MADETVPLEAPALPQGVSPALPALGLGEQHPFPTTLQGAEFKADEAAKYNVAAAAMQAAHDALVAIETDLLPVLMHEGVSGAKSKLNFYISRLKADIQELTSHA